MNNTKVKEEKKLAKNTLILSICTLLNKRLLIEAYPKYN